MNQIIGFDMATTASPVFVGVYQGYRMKGMIVVDVCDAWFRFCVGQFGLTRPSSGCSGARAVRSFEKLRVNESSQRNGSCCKRLLLCVVIDCCVRVLIYF